MRLISAVVAVVFAVPVGGTALCADTTQKWLDRFTSANSTDTSADSTPEEDAAGFESGPFGIVFNEVRTYTPTVREEEPVEGLSDTVEEPVGEVSALEEPPVGEAGSEYAPVVGKALFSTSEDQSQEPASPGIRAAADETPAAKAASDAIQWPEGGFTGETTVTYDANGMGSFEGGATTNVVTTKYDGFAEITKYAHTDNVNDVGVQNGGYGDNKSYSRVVTIPGATSLTVDLTYQTEHTSYDWVCAYAGMNVGNSQCSASLTGNLGGQTKTTKSFTVDGDSVTFWFKSDGSSSNFYGYYAVVSGQGANGETISGTYTVPVDPTDEYKFVGWNTKPGGDGDNLGADEVYSTSSKMVYAQWGIGEGYEKWGTVGWRITNDGILKIRPWKGDTGETGASTFSGNVPWYSNRGKIVKVESVGNIILNINSSSLFSSCSNLTDISSLGGWDVSNVRNMYGMFSSCSNLTDISSLGGWDVSNVRNMYGMFSSCSNLTDISSLGGWDVSNVTDMGSVFSRCSKLSNISYLSNWSVSKVQGMEYLFNYCINLIDLDGLQSWDVSSVLNMRGMFLKTSISDVDELKNWNVSSVKYFGQTSGWSDNGYYETDGMFEYCSKLKDISGLEKWNTESALRMNSMFKNCKELTDISALSRWNVHSVKYFGDDTTYMHGGMFAYCTGLVRIPDLFWDVSSAICMGSMFYRCTGLEDISGLNRVYNTGNLVYVSSMFEGCSSLDRLNGLEGWDVKNVTKLFSVFKNCSNLNNISAISSWDTSSVTSIESVFEGCTRISDISSLVNWNVSKVTNMRSVFRNCKYLSNLNGLEKWNTSSLLYLGEYSSSAHTFGMFEDCTSLVDISALSNWDISNVIDTSFMFSRCASLKDITPLLNWDVSSTKKMCNMFSNCSELTEISSLADWNVGRVEDMMYLFASCSNLLDISGLSNWNVSSVTNMKAMFSSCSNLPDISPLASWDVSSVTNMNVMFSSCSNLTDISALENWDVSKVTGMNSMFYYCSSLTDINALANWNVSKVLYMYRMFFGCSNLQKIGIPSIANGGQNLVNKASSANLTTYMPTIILEDFTLGPYSWSALQSEMQTNPDAFQGGTVWVKYTPSWLVSYNANGGVGSMSGAMTPVNQTLTLPEASYLRFCYKFTGWTTQPDLVSDTNPLMKPGQIFDPYDKTDGKRYTLYAQWEKLDNTDDLPSSSQSGMLPGWVQVESGNTTGLIPPSSSITAWFKNKYAPGSTSLSLQFTKLLEGNAPDRVFQFDLYDVVANKVVQSVQNVGSAVKFDPLVFTKEGVYTYYVRESNTTDDKLIYDNSLRQVTVTVTADKDDPSKLTATAQILGDVTFNNKYKTASLKIRKAVEGTEVKDKDFSFVVDVTKSDGSKLEGTYPTQTGDSPGSVTFQEGIATLQLRADEEVAITGLPANSKYSVDETSLPRGYSIKNLSNPDGMLTPADTVEVTAENRYTTTPGIAQLKALKRYVNAAGQDLPQKNGMFEFAVCEVVSETECNGIGEAQSNDRSEVVFPVISYTDAGNHTYRISEIIGSNTSIAYDRALVTAEVAVTDNGEGELVTTIVYKDKDGNRLPEGELPVFVNRDASASIIPVTGSLAVWSFVAVFGAVALWFASRYIRTLRTGKTGAHAKR